VQYGSKCATLRTSRCPIPAKPQNLATLCRPCLIAADWHLRNPDKNDGLLSLKVLFRSSRWAGSSLRTSDVTSTRTIMSCSLIIVTTKRTSSDTPLSSCLRISRYPPLHSADGYVVRLVLPLIRTSIRTRYFLNIPLLDTWMMRERGKEGLFFVPRLLYLRKRRRRRHRRWWRLRQKRLLSKAPSQTAGRSTVRATRAAARNRNHCEGNAHVPKYRSRVPNNYMFHFYFCLFSFSLVLQAFCCPHLYHAFIVCSCVVQLYPPTNSTVLMGPFI
jgi:hypothetical protein